MFVGIGSSLLCASSCSLFAGCRVLIDVVSLLCGVVCCLLCVVWCVMLLLCCCCVLWQPVAKGFAGVCCSLSDCRCVFAVGLRRLLLDFEVRGVMLLYVVRVRSLLRVMLCIRFANCCCL